MIRTLAEDLLGRLDACPSFVSFCW